MLIPEIAGPLGAHESGGWDPGDHERNGALVPIAFDPTQITHPENRSRCEPGAPAPALARGAHPPAIAFHVTQDPISSSVATPALGCGNALGCGTLGVMVPLPLQEVSHSRANPGGTGLGVGTPGGPMFTLQSQTVHGLQHGMSVRRLTPRECERLQGMPDDYTLVPFGKAIHPEKLAIDWVKYLMRGGRVSFEECCRIASDGPRYRGLGNSMAVPPMRHIGRGIERVDGAEHACAEVA